MEMQFNSYRHFQVISSPRRVIELTPVNASSRIDPLVIISDLTQGNGTTLVFHWDAKLARGITSWTPPFNLGGEFYCLPASSLEALGF